MNILIATFSFPSPSNMVFDGKFVLAEAKAYAASGARVLVITPHFKNAPVVERIDNNIIVKRFSYFVPRSLENLKQPGAPLYSRNSFLAILQVPILCLVFAIMILRHARWADIIHAQWTLSALLALPSKLVYRNKIILTARGSDLRLLPKSLNRFIHRMADGAVDCFGPQPANLEYKKTYNAQFFPLPLIVDYNPSEKAPDDLMNIVNSEEYPFIILYVGRFDPVKLAMSFPFLSLIEAAGLLKALGVSFKVVFIGDGDHRMKMKMLHLIRKEHVYDHVFFLGPRMNVFDYIKYCHLGVGGAAFNAVSQEFTISGKCQLLMDIPLNRNTPWKHGKNVLFARPDCKDIAEKIQWAIGNRNEIETMGNNAREDMDPYISDGKKGGALYLDAFRNLQSR